MNESVVSAWNCRIGPGIDSQHNTLRSKLGRTGADQFRLLNRRRIHRNLIGPRSQRRAYVFNAAYAAANRHRNKYLFSRTPYHVEHSGTLLIGGGDIQEDQFVSAFLIIEPGQFHRIPGIAQVAKIDTLHSTPPFHVEPWHY